MLGSNSHLLTGDELGVVVKGDIHVSSAPETKGIGGNTKLAHSFHAAKPKASEPSAPLRQDVCENYGLARNGSFLDFYRTDSDEPKFASSLLSGLESDFLLRAAAKLVHPSDAEGLSSIVLRARKHRAYLHAIPRGARGRDLRREWARGAHRLLCRRVH